MTNRANEERIVNEGASFPAAGAERRRVDMSGFTLYMLGHAHIDLAYRWDYSETVHKIAPWTFRGVLELMGRVDGATFCQSQAYLYDAMEREYPAVFEAIKEKIREGNWEFVGGSWCEYDAILCGGESVIRQHLHGTRYAEEKLGVSEHTVAFVPDSFIGHSATLPQLLAGCGFKYYIFGRGIPHDPQQPERTKRAFFWRGPDGSGVVAYFVFGPYSTPPITEEVLASFYPYIQASVDPRELVLYGVGDHGGGPRDEDIEKLEALRGAAGAPNWRYSTAAHYCDTVLSRLEGSLQTYSASMVDASSGALTSQARVKRQNRKLERKLLATESLSLIGALLQRKPFFPRVEFRCLWREYLTHQFHDVITGTSVASVYRGVARSYSRMERELSELSDDSLARVAARLDTRGDGDALLVFNPALEAARGLASVELPARLAGAVAPAIQLRGSDGHPIESGSNGNRLFFRAELPALGYECLRVVQASDAEQRLTPCRGLAPDGSLEYGSWRIRFDMVSGDLIFAANAGREVLKGPSNSLLLIEESMGATSWVHLLSDRTVPLKLVEPPRVVEQTKFFVRISATSRSRFSEFTRDVIVPREGGRLDFRLNLDWRESNAFLKLGFSTALDSPAVSSALAHGTVMVDEPESEFCIHEHAILRDRDAAIAFFNDGCYGADLIGEVLRLSVVRNARDMGPSMDHGRHELEYAIADFDASAPVSEMLREQAGFLSNFSVRWESAHPGGIAAWGGKSMLDTLQPKGSFVKINPANVALCALKMPEDDWTPKSIVARVRETDGKAVECEVTLPARAVSATLADHIERERPGAIGLDGNSVSFSLKPFELVTFIARLE